MNTTIHIIPITHIRHVASDTDLCQAIATSIQKQHLTLQEQDILIVTQKIISKAEGRVVSLMSIIPSDLATRIAKDTKKDPRYIELILRESKRIVRMDHGVIISETHHGFICANAGVDASNVKEAQAVALLPQNPDLSAQILRKQLEKKYTCRLAVLITDTWGRPWREGQVNVAIGSSGLETLMDYRGKHDAYGLKLQASVIAIADELASAAELVMGKFDAIPAAIIRGYPYRTGHMDARSLLRNPSTDMFR